MTAFILFATLVLAQDLSFNYTPAPGPGENPALLVTPTRPVTTLYASIQVGGKTLEFTRKSIAEGQQVRFEWARDPKVTHAEVFLRATFADGAVSEQTVPVNYQFKGTLSVNLSGATANITDRTVTVKVVGGPTEAEIVAYGAHKTVIDKSTVAITDNGNGTVTVPFVGDPAEVVLLDVTLRNDSAYSGFTYSPWFLDIPHDDVLFLTDSADIPKDQEWKLEATLEQLHDVLDKYGAIVPVKLYIAGCTDTVGDDAHNRDLSFRRASSIARWIRAHGYSQPIFYYGFGESLLAAPTGDGVDNALNRRALYMVGANPPPPGSGVPAVGWKGL